MMEHLQESTSLVPDVNSTTFKTTINLYHILTPTLGAIIILLNLIVVISSGLIIKRGHEPRTTYMFLGNVAMADLITGISVVFGQTYPKKITTHVTCAIQLGMIVSSTLSSIYSVGLICIDRFLYITHGMHYNQWIYPRRATYLILVTWIIGCTVGFMPFFGWYGDTGNGKFCWFIYLTPKDLILFTVAVGFIPIFVVIILNLIILYHSLHKIVQLQNQRSVRRRDASTSTENNGRKKSLMARIFKKPPTPISRSPSRLRAIKIILFTISTFVICWCPYFIASIYYVYHCTKETESTKKCKNLQLVIASPLAILGFANSFLNPIIYAWWHKGFRNYVQKRVSTIRTRWTRNSIENSSTVVHRNGANGNIATIENIATLDTKL